MYNTQEGCGFKEYVVTAKNKATNEAISVLNPNTDKICIGPRSCLTRTFSVSSKMIIEFDVKMITYAATVHTANPYDITIGCSPLKETYDKVYEFDAAPSVSSQRIYLTHIFNEFYTTSGCGVKTVEL